MLSKTHLACNFIGKNNTKAMYKYLALEVLFFSCEVLNFSNE